MVCDYGSSNKRKCDFFKITFMFKQTLNKHFYFRESMNNLRKAPGYLMVDFKKKLVYIIVENGQEYNGTPKSRNPMEPGIFYCLKDSCKSYRKYLFQSHFKQPKV